MKKQLILWLCMAAPTLQALGEEGAAMAPEWSAVGEAVADTSKVVDLDEVTVVSHPKDLFRLRQQPLSSSLFGADDLQRLSASDLRRLSDFVPSFTMPDYGSRYTSSMYIRGIGSRVNSPAVGLYVDNIPIVSKSMMNTHTYNLQRIDVLRGPQGTLYGQNTEGGLLRLYTRSPLQYEGTDVRLSLGNHLQRLVEASHHRRLSSVLGLGVAAFYNGTNGYLRNASTDRRADSMDEAGGRLKLAWAPLEGLAIQLLSDYQWVYQHGFAYGELTPSGSILAPATNRQGHYRRHALTNGLSLSYQTADVQLDYALSHQWLSDQMLMDIDYRPEDYMHLTQRQLHNALTQELSLKSRRPSRWQWTTGAFFSHQWLRTDAPVFFDDAMNGYLSHTIEQYAYQGMLQAMAKRMGLEQAQQTIERAGGCHINLVIDAIPGLFHTPQANYALFHESAIALTPRLTATLGLRYDISQASIDYRTSALMHLSESVMGQQVEASVSSLLEHSHSTSFEQLLPKAALSYRLSEAGSRLYATFSKGYRAGGYNIQMFSDILQTELEGAAQSARGDVELPHSPEFFDNLRHTIAYKPEESYNLEVGTHLNLLQGKLQADLSAYLMHIRNQQLSVMAGNYGFGRMMVNAGRSRSLGVEAAVRGSLLDNRLQYSASYALTKAIFRHYTDSITAADGQTQAVSYRGKRVPFIPRHTLALTADYRLPLALSPTVGINLTAQGPTYWDEQNSSRQSFYALLGAHADVEPVSWLSLSLWARNLLDHRYATFAVSSPMAGTTSWFAQQGQPFQMGLDLRVHL